MRLDKFLADAAGFTRSEAKKQIKEGRVTVDGLTARSPEQHVDGTEAVELDGQTLKLEGFLYIMMNKPAGVLSATEDKHSRTVLDLLGEGYSRRKLFPVGRLDKDTEGLLMLTDDGRLAHALLSPKNKIGKTYFARLEGPISEKEIDILENGVDIGGYVTLPCKVKKVAETEVEITIIEGKFHQVKRMFEAVNNRVCYLKRVSFAGLELDKSLEPGKFRQLCTKEKNKILHLIQ